MRGDITHSFAGALPNVTSVGVRQCRQGMARLLATRHPQQQHSLCRSWLASEEARTADIFLA
jgi:hypothetical protein